MSNNFDIAVIGGGASGLFFTALYSKLHKEHKIAVIEKNQRVGKKLLVTGNGRCNLTNLYTQSNNFHGSFASFHIFDILDMCPPEKVLDLFKEMGLITRADECGRVYPKSNQASSVLDVLRYNCESENVSFLCEEKVIKAEKKKDIFTVTTDKRMFTCKKLVIASGGAAAPKAGGDKSGYDLLKSLGHTVIKPSPALCPVGVKSELLKSLKGIRVQGEVALICDGNEVSAESGEVQFAENALSGICVFNLSQYVENDKKYKLRIRLMPDVDFNEITRILTNNRRVFSNLEAENLMTGIFHKRVAQALMKTAGIAFNKKVSEITDKEIKSLAKTINGFDFEVTGLGDFSNAQVTKGGVKGNEVISSTMESKKTQGLYILGEALDCNGDCGGFNLHFAFATAYIAANGLWLK